MLLIPDQRPCMFTIRMKRMDKFPSPAVMLERARGEGDRGTKGQCPGMAAVCFELRLRFRVAVWV